MNIHRVFKIAQEERLLSTGRETTKKHHSKQQFERGTK
jgi:hypothetical protein